MSTVEKRVLSGLITGTSKDVPPGQTLPGDVNIESCLLISEDQQREVDIISLVQNISVYESITRCTVVASMTMLDSINLLQQFPIVGEEYVLLEFSTPSSDTARYLMRIKNVADVEALPNGRATTYTLVCVSPEIFTNARMSLTRRVDQSIDQSITQILRDDLGTEKQLFAEPTSGRDQTIITGLEPFKAIDYLRQRATSNRYLSSSFVFFENARGYHLSTVERLLDVQRENIGDRVFFYDSSVREDLTSNEYRNILAFQQSSFSDSYSHIAGGALNNEVARFDFITGALSNRQYVRQQYTTADKDGREPRSESFYDTHGQTTRITNLIPYDSTRPDRYDEKVANSRAFVEQLLNNVVLFTVYGDSQLAVGNVVELNFPAPTDKTNASEYSIDSGNYLITKLRHMITVGDRPQHLITCQAVKNNYQRG